MYDVEDIFEIDLAQGSDSGEIIDNAAMTLSSIDRVNVSIKLKLGNISINQSQMVFLKSLIESFNHKLTFVETSNPYTRDVCLAMDINTTSAAYIEDINTGDNNANELQNSKLDDLREEFKHGLQNSILPEELKENTQENSLSSNAATQPEDDTKKTFEEENIQKKTIGVYRKADEEENRLEFLHEEDVDFYAVSSNEPIVADTKNTIYVHQTLRNGQVLDYDGNVVVIGDCHPGSEIKATGDITVWGVLGSIAHAGIKGNSEAKIRALKMNAVQLRIANCYSRRPDGTNIPYAAKSSVFTPEEARIVDDNIVLFKMAQD